MSIVGPNSRTAVYVIRTYGGQGGSPCKGRSYPNRPWKMPVDGMPYLRYGYPYEDNTQYQRCYNARG